MGKYDNLVIYSNLIYILPVIVAFYKYFVQKNLQLDDLIILTIGFSLLILYSLFYHNCINKMNVMHERGEWQKEKHDELKKNKYPFQIIYECSDGNLSIPYNIAKVRDTLMGLLMHILLLLIIIGVGKKTKFTVLLCSLFYIITILSYNKLKNLYLHVIPLGLAVLFLIYHLVKSFNKYSSLEKICIGIAIIFIIIGAILKLVMQKISEHKAEKNKKKEENKDKYFKHINDKNLYHSLWTIFTGVGMALLLLPKIQKNQYKLFVN
tara:strand:- start:586 stop:1380 length:795 start_codon:yes stop_codon:yes gene_type:complete